MKSTNILMKTSLPPKLNKKMSKILFKNPLNRVKWMKKWWYHPVQAMKNPIESIQMRSSPCRSTANPIKPDSIHKNPIEPDRKVAFRFRSLRKCPKKERKRTKNVDRCLSTIDTYVESIRGPTPAALDPTRSTPAAVDDGPAWQSSARRRDAPAAALRVRRRRRPLERAQRHADDDDDVFFFVADAADTAAADAGRR